ncbi:hypothetical protein FALBO_6930 [Fusarium albosuccineum]|uniref:Uncharacterized protein n=1 Tax=Fusarium albosuccineum TaxID=1237068 RepID=A0A8H4PE71_9HYPO|nr:hypothetical protein FALBO_6930 [Fusarium albosuccineum]
MPSYVYRPDIPKKLGFKDWPEIFEVGEENLKKQQEWWEAGGKYRDGLLQSMASSSGTTPQRRRAAVNRKNAYESESEGEAQAAAKVIILRLIAR